MAGRVEASPAQTYRGTMTHPGAEPTHDKAHRHIDLGALMDGSERGPEVTEEDEYGQAADLSGETVDGYVSGQDEGSID